MTAPTTLPPEVARIVAELRAGASTLPLFSQHAISEAFKRGLIEASVSNGQGRTRYVLRGQTASEPRSAYSYSLEIS